MRHIPVLLNEVIELLKPEANQNFVDCTLGDGGHSEAMLERTAPAGKLLGIDADPESLLRAKQYLYRFEERTRFVRDNFVNLEKILKAEQFGPVNKILIDLGWSSPQFAERGRGFSFDPPAGGDEPLDMRYAGTQGGGETAAQIINTYSEGDLHTIFKTFGEEKLSREIAEAIVMARKAEPIERTSQLVEIILSVYREKLHSTKEVPWIGGLHPATKVFQALRMAVNKELDVIKTVLPAAVAALAPGGRLAVIAFHSGEDRIVKHYFAEAARKKMVTLVNKKPLVATEDEAKQNPRARSAKLRVVEKI